MLVSNVLIFYLFTFELTFFVIQPTLSIYYDYNVNILCVFIYILHYIIIINMYLVSNAMHYLKHFYLAVVVNT